VQLCMMFYWHQHHCMRLLLKASRCLGYAPAAQ
jgi:hypothetical protein